MADIGGNWKSVAGPITDTWYRPVFTIDGDTPAFIAAVVAGIQ
jgi:hypothetical protein